MPKIKYLVIHWTASGSNTTVDQIRKWHKAKGWRDIGYHRVILHPRKVRNCEEWYQLVKQGRKINDDHFLSNEEKGAHAYGLNHNSVGVVVVGEPSLALDPLQRLALINTIKILCERYDIVPKNVIGHRDVKRITHGVGTATACPGDEIYKIIKEYQTGAYQ